MLWQQVVPHHRRWQVGLAPASITKLCSTSFSVTSILLQTYVFKTHVCLHCYFAAYAGYTILSGNFPGSQANYDVLLKKQLAGISEKDRAAAAAIAVPIADEILLDK